MNFLKHLGFLSLAGALVLAAALSAGKGQAAGQTTRRTVTPVSNAVTPVRTAYGKVKSIVGPVLTLDVGRHDMTFTVDESTDVLARGDERAGLPIVDLVRTGDLALVAYRESSGRMLVSEIHLKDRNRIASR